MDEIKNDNVWQFQDTLSRRLLRWAAGSVILGTLMRFGGLFCRSMGNQFIAWGSVDALIAIFGQIQKRNRVDQTPNPGKEAVRKEEAANLRQLLWLNAALDLLYILGGLWWSKRDNGDGQARGNGLGVMIQGVFLLVFDVFHAMNMPDDD